MPLFIKQKTIDSQINQAVDRRVKRIMQDEAFIRTHEFNINPSSVINLKTGQGTAADIGTGSFHVVPNIIEQPEQLETSYIGSSAIAKMINIPVDDMFLRERVIENLPDDELKLLNDEYDRFGLNELLPQFIKSSRVFGTALMSIISADDLLVNPLDIGNIRQGDIKNIIFTDRFQASITNFQRNALNARFGKPEEYHMFISGTVSKQFLIHASRVIRLDAVRALSTAGWSFSRVNSWWGISLIGAALTAILGEDTLYSNTNTLVQRASVLIMMVDQLRDARAGLVKDTVTNKECSTIKEELLRFIEEMNTNSISAIDKENSVMRLEVGFQGLASLFEQFQLRVASVADQVSYK